MENKKIPLLFLLFVVSFVFLSKDYEYVLTRASINFSKTDFSAVEQKINFTVSAAVLPKIAILRGDDEVKDIAVRIFNQENFQPASLMASMAGVAGYKVELERPSSFKPGKYTIKIGNSTKEFWWGVMAINSNKSVYEKGDTARLMMTLLDDGGRTVCGNYLEAKIISPSGIETNFSTDAKSIKISPACGSFAADSPPDYDISRVVDELGEYKIVARSLPFPGSSEEHEISTSFIVGGPFIIERIGPTRIYPPNHYQVKINITSAYEPWEGNITEKVPDVFVISCDDCKTLTNKNTALANGIFIESQLEPQRPDLTPASSIANKKDLSSDKSLLLRGPAENRTPETQVSNLVSAPAQAHETNVSWHISFRKGETKTLTYTFKAPNISPEFYLLGPLVFMESKLGAWTTSDVQISSNKKDLSNVSGLLSSLQDNSGTSINKNTTISSGILGDSSEMRETGIGILSSIVNKNNLSIGVVDKSSSEPVQRFALWKSDIPTPVSHSATGSDFKVAQSQNNSIENVGTFSFQEPRQWQIAADATVTWDNGGGNGLWGTATNWSGDALPGAGDVATFNDTTTTNSFVNVSSTLNGLSIASTYTGVITMATSTPLPLFTIGGSGFSQAGGTLTMNNGVMQVGGVFSQTGSSILNSSGTLLLNATSSVTFTPSSTLSNLIINDGLVGYWKLDENSLNNSSSVTDYSGYGNTGTAVSMGSGSGPSSTVSSQIKFNNPKSFNFDGTNDYVVISPINFSTPKTISFWINFDADPSIIIFGGANFSNNYYCYFEYDGSNNEIFISDSGGFTKVNFVAGANVTFGRWYHVAVTGDGTTATFYRDGVSIGMGTDRSPTGITKVGGNYNGGFFLDGLLDDIRIYNRALSAGEINALYLGNQPATSFAGNTQTLASALTVNGNLSLNSGWLDASSSNITVSGNWLNHGGLFNPRSNTVTLNGTATNGEILSGSQTFGNLTINGSGGTYFLDDRLSVSSTLALNSGTLNVATGTGAFKLRAGTISQTGGFFTASSGTVIIDGVASSTLTVSSTLNNLQFESTRESGLVGYWKFDEGTGSSTRDWSGNGNTGYFVSSSTSPFATSTVNATTTYDNPFSLSFDGTDDYVEVANSRLFDFTNEIYTHSQWFRKNALGTTKYLIFKASNLSPAGWGMYIQSDNTLRITHGGNPVATTTFTISANTWYHAVGVSDGTTAKIYIDGIERASGSVGAITNEVDPVLIGRDTGNSFPFDGLIDDVRIYNRALSAGEVAELAKGRYPTGGPANATSSPTFTLGSALTVSSSLTIFNGILDASTSNYGITLGGNWSNYSTSTAFVGRSGTLTLNGVEQSISGTSTFNNFTKIVTVSSSLTFATGTTQTILSTLTLQGVSGGLLSIQSNQSGSRWRIDPQGTRTVSYLKVQDSQNINASTVVCSNNCTDSGGNIGWSFSGEAGGGGGGGAEGSGGGSQQSGGGGGGGGGAEGGGGGTATSSGGGQGGGDGGSGSVLATMGWIFEMMMEWILDLFEKIIKILGK